MYVTTFQFQSQQDNVLLSASSYGVKILFIPVVDTKKMYLNHSIELVYGLMVTRIQKLFASVDLLSHECKLHFTVERRSKTDMQCV